MKIRDFSRFVITILWKHSLVVKIAFKIWSIKWQVRYQKIEQRSKEGFVNAHFKCPIYTDTEIKTLSEFFAVFHSLLDPKKVFWFRGHSRLTYKLSPSALRYSSEESRNKALSLVTEMKRFLEMKLPRPPAADDDLGWMQVAQHYGLPTRLLDWTQNAAVALFFACWTNQKDDGLVAVINPIELNQSVDARLPRVFTFQKDAGLIQSYLKMDGSGSQRGRKTIAINPNWNTERIAMQQGVFTLHGKRFEIDSSQASSLICVPILKEHKLALLNELERVGIGEMFIFPEPEHVCAHLLRSAKI